MSASQSRPRFKRPNRAHSPNRAIVLTLSFLATLTLGLLALAPAASAVEIGGSGIHSYWGNLDTANSQRDLNIGGGFNRQGPRGIDVNEATGDVYVADTGNNRVQQFTADGEFIRAWGRDVIVSSGSPPNSNGTAYEICDATTTPPNTVAQCKAGTTSPVQGGTMNRPAGLAINQQTGDVYVIDAGTNASTGNRIQVFDSEGNFLRAFGQDVVSGSGGENSPARPAVQTLTVDATAGQFRLSFQGFQTGDLSFDAPATGAGSVQAALEGLDSIGAGNVTVTGADGGPYTITFAGLLTNSPQPAIAATDGTTPLSGGAGTEIATTQHGATGFEVCTVAANCKAGVSTPDIGGVISMPNPNGGTRHGDLTIAPQGAPNAGNLLVTDPNRARVQEFTAAGEFVRAFGFDVAAVGPGNAGTDFEVCRASTFDICKAGASVAGAGNAAGQFAASAVTRIAEDKDGNIYTVEGTNSGPGTSDFRVQKFALPANTPTPQGDFACDKLCGTDGLAAGGGVVNANDNPIDVAVDADGFVYVVKSFPLGTGTPPVTELFLTNVLSRQYRILKLDPVSESIEKIFLVNPGTYENIVVHSADMGIAVRAAGQPLYSAASNGNTANAVVPRIYRIDEIEGAATELSVSDVGATTATFVGTASPADISFDSSYRFEYSRVGFDDWSQFRVPAATSTDDSGLNIGNGSDGGESDSCSPNPGSRAKVCHVVQSVDGLEVNQSYQVRLVVTTEYNGLTYTSDPVEFETEPTPPLARTGSAVWSGPPESDPTLTFNGQVTPQGVRTSYRFEYVSETEFSESGFDNAAQAPFADREVGHGIVDLEVSAVADLDPSSAYRYRLVASNPEGETVGETRKVDPPSQGDRFIELVSDGDGKGGGVVLSRVAVSDDGERAAFLALAFGEQQAAPFTRNPNIAIRDAGGWSPRQMGPDPRDASLGGGVTDLAGAWGDASVTRRLWGSSPQPGLLRWKTRGLNGSLTSISPVLSPLSLSGDGLNLRLLGGTADFSTLAFALRGATLFPGEVLPSRGSNLYLVTDGGDPSEEMHLVNRDSGGEPLGGTCGATLGNGDFTTNAISSDGSVVYFRASPTAPTAADCPATPPPARIFKRVDNETTVAVSESQCDRQAPEPACNNTLDGSDLFRGASADGSKVFFMTNRQLADSDLDSTGPFGLSACESSFSALFLGGCDLYLYDSSPPAGQPNLVQVSLGEATDTHPIPGSGAGVLGVSGVSMDGSRVYFVATGKLVDGATEGGNNLYVYERSEDYPEGRISFIASLSTAPADQFNAADKSVWLPNALGNGGAGMDVHVLPYYDGLGADRGDGDGHLLIFRSEVQLLPEDEDSAMDLYRWDDSAEELTCLTCSKHGDFDALITGLYPGAMSMPDAIQSQRVASEDGTTIAFATSEQMLPEDTNRAIDGYIWREGEGLSLVTGGTGDRGILVEAFEDASTHVATAGPAMSPDGKSVFFTTRATMLPGDTNNGGIDVYAARVGGGFRQPIEPAVCALLAGGCQDGGADSAPTATKTVSSRTDGNFPSGSGEAPAVRKRLAVVRPSVGARRRAARSGRLAVAVHATAAGRVTVTARARVGKKARRVARGSKRIQPGRTRVNMRLSGPARQHLRAGRRLGLRIVVRQPGARARSMRVVLPGVAS